MKNDKKTSGKKYKGNWRLLFRHSGRGKAYLLPESKNTWGNANFVVFDEPPKGFQKFTATGLFMEKSDSYRYEDLRALAKKCCIPTTKVRRIEFKEKWMLYPLIEFSHNELSDFGWFATNHFLATHIEFAEKNYPGGKWFGNDERAFTYRVGRKSIIITMAVTLEFSSDQILSERLFRNEKF